MKTKEGSTRIVNFITPGVGVLVVWHIHTSYIVKIRYFFKHLFLFSHAENKQSKYTGMMTKEGSIKILNFMTPMAGVLCEGMAI